LKIDCGSISIYCWYLVKLYSALKHDEGYDELASALGQVQEVLVDVVICQNFVCSTPAYENASDSHAMGFPCDDISVSLPLPNADNIPFTNTEIICCSSTY
jgi:hypothetical protein